MNAMSEDVQKSRQELRHRISACNVSVHQDLRRDYELRHEGGGDGGEQWPRGRMVLLRRLLLAGIADQLMEDLEGGELFKEVWEACETEEESQEVQDELGRVIEVLLAAEATWRSET